SPHCAKRIITWCTRADGSSTCPPTARRRGPDRTARCTGPAGSTTATPPDRTLLRAIPYTTCVPSSPTSRSVVPIAASTGDEHPLVAGAIRRVANLFDGEPGGGEIRLDLGALPEPDRRIGDHGHRCRERGIEH